MTKELLIVVVIIGILAAIVIPKLIRTNRIVNTRASQEIVHGVYKVYDEKTGVTCYYTGAGISCLRTN